MRTQVKRFVLVGLFVCLFSGWGKSQQKSGTAELSLGDIARELKAQKTKETKPGKVFTNDNLRSSRVDAGFGVNPSDMKTRVDAAPGDDSGSHGETYFRSQLSRLQSRLETHTRELNVLQQKLGLNQSQYYADPNKTLQEEYTRTDINKYTDEINEKKRQIADDEKAIEVLHDQLRHEGGDPAWLR
jgi:hypothetical protein